MVNVDEASKRDPLPRPIRCPVTTYIEYISYGPLCLRKVTASKHMIDVLRIRLMKRNASSLEFINKAAFAVANTNGGAYMP